MNQCQETTWIGEWALKDFVKFTVVNSSLDDKLFKVSVREIVENQCPELRTRNSSDVMGASYKMPDTSAYLVKPHPFTISKSKDRDYLAPILKQKKDLPSPTQYDVTNSIIMKKNLVIYKTDRRSFCDDIAKKSKEVPGVGLYNPKTDEKIKGTLKR